MTVAVYLWETPGSCGVSMSLEAAQQHAMLNAGAGGAKVEAAWPATQTQTLEPRYARTGEEWTWNGARWAKTAVRVTA